MRRLPVNHGNVTPFDAGRKAERDFAIRRGMRQHPASGAGQIKGDASSDEAVVEFKLINPGTKSHQVSVSQVLDTIRAAELTNREAWYVIHIPEHNITIEGRIRRGMP